jgi:hypothetical protein
MSKQAWIYVAAAAATLLLVVAVVVYFTTGSLEAAGGVGAAAALAAAKALKDRQEARKSVGQAKQDAAAAMGETKQEKEDADTDIKAVREEVAGMTDDEKKAEGEALFLMSDESKQLWWAKNWGLFIGIPFTVLVAGLILYGNFFASSENPQTFEWEYRPDLYVCDTAPDWTKPDSKDFAKAMKFWEGLGFAFNNIETGPCPKTCEFTDQDSGKKRTVACNLGKVTLDLRDQWFSEDHAGECVRPNKDVLRDNDWTTMLFPSVIYGSDDIDAEMLPPDVNAQTLGHETGHCLAGVDHNLGAALGCGGGCRLNSKTGALMNPTIYGGGWVDEGLPAPPEGWKL